jgi:hypothetical protein
LNPTVAVAGEEGAALVAGEGLASAPLAMAAVVPAPLVAAEGLASAPLAVVAVVPAPLAVAGVVPAPLAVAGEAAATHAPGRACGGVANGVLPVATPSSPGHRSPASVVEGASGTSLTRPR